MPGPWNANIGGAVKGAIKSAAPKPPEKKPALTDPIKAVEPSEAVSAFLKQNNINPDAYFTGLNREIGKGGAYKEQALFSYGRIVDKAKNLYGTDEQHIGRQTSLPTFIFDPKMVGASAAPTQTGVTQTGISGFMNGVWNDLVVGISKGLVQLPSTMEDLKSKAILSFYDNPSEEQKEKVRNFSHITQYGIWGMLFDKKQTDAAANNAVSWMENNIEGYINPMLMSGGFKLKEDGTIGFDPNIGAGTIGNLTGSVLSYLLPGMVAGKFAAAGESAKLLQGLTTAEKAMKSINFAQRAGGFAGGSMLQMGAMLDVAREKGLMTNQDDRENVAAVVMAATPIIAMIDMLTGAESMLGRNSVTRLSQEALLNSLKQVGKQGLTKDIFNDVVRETSKGYIKSLFSALKSPTKILKRAAVGTVNEGITEAIQGAVEDYGYELYDKLYADPSGRPGFDRRLFAREGDQTMLGIFNKEAFVNELNQGFLGGLMGGAMGSIHSVGGDQQLNETMYGWASSLLKAGKSPEEVMGAIAEVMDRDAAYFGKQSERDPAKSNGQLVMEDATQIIKSIMDFEALGQVNNPSARWQAYQLGTTKAGLDEQVRAYDEQVRAIDEKITEIQTTNPADVAGLTALKTTRGNVTQNAPRIDVLRDQSALIDQTLTNIGRMDAPDHTFEPKFAELAALLPVTEKEKQAPEPGNELTTDSNLLTKPGRTGTDPLADPDSTEEALQEIIDENKEVVVERPLPLGLGAEQGTTPKEIAEAYHEAKDTGENPALVAAVEDVLRPENVSRKQYIDDYASQIINIQDEFEREGYNAVIDPAGNLIITDKDGNAVEDIEQLPEHLQPMVDTLNGIIQNIENKGADPLTAVEQAREKYRPTSQVAYPLFDELVQMTVRDINAVNDSVLSEYSEKTDPLEERLKAVPKGKKYDDARRVLKKELADINAELNEKQQLFSQDISRGIAAYLQKKGVDDEFDQATFAGDYFDEILYRPGIEYNWEKTGMEVLDELFDDTMKEAKPAEEEKKTRKKKAVEKKPVEEKPKSKAAKAREVVREKIAEVDDELAKAMEDFVGAIGGLQKLEGEEGEAKVFQLGIKMVKLFTERGVYKLADISLAVADKFGDAVAQKVLPYLKDAYNAARGRDKANRAEYNSEEEVDDYQLEKTESDEQPTERTTEIITTEAEVAINEAENAATDEQRGAAVEKIDDLIEEINAKLDKVTISRGEFKPGPKAQPREYPHYEVEKEIKKEVVKFAKALAQRLGWEHDTDKKGKPMYGTTNLAPAGGDGTIILWHPDSKYGVYISIPFQPTEYEDWYEKYQMQGTLNGPFWGGDRGSLMWRITSKDNKYTGFSNQWLPISDFSVGTMAPLIQRAIKPYLAKEAEAGSDLVADTKPKGPKIIINTIDNSTENAEISSTISGQDEDTSTTATTSTDDRSGRDSDQLDEIPGGEQSEVSQGTQTEGPVGDGGDAQVAGVSGEPGTTENTGLPAGGRRGSSTRDAIPVEDLPSQNYIIPEDLPIEKSFNQKTRFQDNLNALRVLNSLFEEGRDATPAEQVTLSKYVGWGGIKVVLNPEDSIWPKSEEPLRPLVAELKEVIAGLEKFGIKNVMDNIKASTLNAHYTDIRVVRSIYAGIEHLGFDGGRILEPSAGIGNFIGAIPQNMAHNSAFTAVELDKLTGNLLTKLYPKSLTHVTGLQDAGLPDNYYDLIISNVPFGTYPVFDKSFTSKELKPLAQRIHNYFFAKSLQQAKPGGLIAFVTSAGLMDSAGNKNIREYIAKNAEFLGAVRLPNTTFKGNANTEVVTDVIFLRKTENPVQQHKFMDRKQLDVAHKNTGEKKTISVNEYFRANPDNVIGEFKAGGLYSDSEMTLIAPTDIDIAARLTERLLATLPKNIYQPERETHKPKPSTKKAAKKSDQKEEVADESEIYDTAGPGEIYIRDGKAYVNRSSKPVSKSLFEKMVDALANVGEDEADTVGDPLPESYSIQKVKDFIKLRYFLNQQYQLESENNVAADIEYNRKNLNEVYDAFVKKYGNLNDKKNKPLFTKDVNGFNMLSLENIDKEAGVVNKADIFSKRVIQAREYKTSADTIHDAINITYNETGHVNVHRIASLMGESEQDVVAKNYGVLFYDSDGAVVTRDEYLSGNVKRKLSEARAMVPKNALYEKNVEELEKVIPKDIPAVNIDVNIGARWVPTTDYVNFINNLLNTDSAYVKYISATDTYKVAGNETVESRNKYGTPRISAYKLIEQAMHGQSPVIQDLVDRNPDKYVTNKPETQKAIEKQQVIIEAFGDWIWKDADRRNRLGAMYNDRFNTNVKRSHDGSYITIDGLNNVNLREHQLDAVAMIVNNNGGIIDHIVGAGKTYVMISAALKMKQLGMANKPTIIGLKSTIPHLVSDAKEAFPTAKILTPSESDFSSKKRKAFLSRIQNNDWDLIIMSHEQFGAIQNDPEIIADTIREQIQALEHEIEMLKKEGNSPSKQLLKGLEARKLKLSVKLQELLAAPKDAEILNFKQLGIDHLFVDESQQFKNLEYATRITSVAGLGNPRGSKRAFNLLTSIRTLQKMYGGDKGATFLSGTPISNSLVELYLLFKYLRPDKMKELGYKTFDSWVKQFAVASNELEFAVTGAVKQKTRFREFINVPELSLLYNEITDLRNDDNLKLPKPVVRGGGPELVLVQQSEYQQEWTRRLIEFSNQQHGQRDGTLIGKGELTENQQNAAMLMVTGISNKLSIDMRLIDKHAEDNPSGKLSAAASNIIDFYKNSESIRGTQLVFCDSGTPKAKNLVENVKGYMEDELNIGADDIVAIFGEEGTKLPALDKVRQKIAEVLEYDEATIEQIIADARESEGQFNVYDELKRKLMEKGIPANEIAFIHSYNTKAARAGLYDAVNRGEIRVVIGSTQKLGTGVNVQKRIVALHHLDAQWNPAAMEQRNGRGIRQGNMNKEVAILYYGTELTLDAYKYQLIANKQRFITQVKSGALHGERSVKEDEGEDMGAQAIVAQLSGNPLLLEKAQIDSKVDKLKKSRRNFEGEVYEAVSKRDSLLVNIPNIEQEIARREKDIDTIRKNGEIKDGKVVAAVTIDGKIPEATKELGELVIKKKNDLKKKPVGHTEKIGEANGLDLMATVAPDYDPLNPSRQVGIKVDLSLRGDLSYTVTSSSDPTAQGRVISITLEKMQDRLELRQEDLERSRTNAVKFDELTRQKWSKQDELDKLLARQREINTELEVQSNPDNFYNDVRKRSISGFEPGDLVVDTTEGTTWLVEVPMSEQGISVITQVGEDGKEIYGTTKDEPAGSNENYILKSQYDEIQTKIQNEDRTGNAGRDASDSDTDADERSEDARYQRAADTIRNAEKLVVSIRDRIKNSSGQGNAAGSAEQSGGATDITPVINQAVSLSQIENEGVTLYHGTNNIFNRFVPGRIGTGEGPNPRFGDGYYLTDSNAVADFYAHETAKKEFIQGYSNKGIFGTQLPIYMPNADQLAEAKKQTLRFRIKGKILDATEYSFDEAFQKHVADLFAKHSGWKGDDARRIVEGKFEYLKANKGDIHNYRGELDYIIQQVGMGDKNVVDGIINYIKGMGYDGIRYMSDPSYEGSGSHNYVIYNEAAITERVTGETAPAGRLTADQVTALNNTFQRVFPNVQFSTDKAAYLKALNEVDPAGVENYPSGFVYNGVFYLNPDKVYASTQLHEVGHIFTSWAKQYAPEMYKKIISLGNSAPAEIQQFLLEEYPELVPGSAAFAEEAFVTFMGERGKERVQQYLARPQNKTWYDGIVKAFKDLVSRITAFVRNRMGGNISGLKNMNVADMNIAEFSDYLAKQLLSGKQISDISSDTLREIEGMNDGLVRMQNDLEDIEQYALNAARKLLALGVPIDQIYSHTGWRVNTEGNWELNREALDKSKPLENKYLALLNSIGTPKARFQKTAIDVANLNDKQTLEMLQQQMVGRSGGDVNSIIADIHRIFDEYVDTLATARGANNDIYLSQDFVDGFYDPVVMTEVATHMLDPAQPINAQAKMIIERLFGDHNGSVLNQYARWLEADNYTLIIQEPNGNIVQEITPFEDAQDTADVAQVIGKLNNNQSGLLSKVFGKMISGKSVGGWISKNTLFRHLWNEKTIANMVSEPGKAFYRVLVDAVDAARTIALPHRTMASTFEQRLIDKYNELSLFGNRTTYANVQKIDVNAENNNTYSLSVGEVVSIIASAHTQTADGYKVQTKQKGAGPQYGVSAINSKLKIENYQGQRDIEFSLIDGEFSRLEKLIMDPTFLGGKPLQLYNELKDYYNSREFRDLKGNVDPTKLSLFDTIAKVYEIDMAKKLPRSAMYFPIQTYGNVKPTNRKDLRNNSQLLDDVSILHERSMIVAPLVIKDAIQTLHEFNEKSINFIEYWIPTRNIDTLMNRNEQWFKNNGLQYLAENMRDFASNLNNIDKLEYEANKGMTAKPAKALLSGFTISRLGFNLFTPTRQFGGYMIAHGLGIIKSEYLNREFGDTLKQTAFSYGAFIREFKNYMAGKPVSDFSIDKVRFDKIAANPYAYDTLYRITNPNLYNMEDVVSQFFGINKFTDSVAKGYWSKFTNFFSTVGMAAIKQADAAIIMGLYDAAEAQINDEMPTATADEKLRATAGLSAQVLYATQQTNVLSDKTPLQNSHGTMDRIMSIFTAQVQKMINTQAQLYLKFAKADNEADRELYGNQFNWAVSTMYITNAFYMALISSVASWIRGGGKDDEDNTFAENFKWNFIRELGAYIPGFTGEAASFLITSVDNQQWTDRFGGVDIYKGVTTAGSGLIKTGKGLTKKGHERNKAIHDGMLKTFEGLSDITGVSQEIVRLLK